jgi:hypothetical protein
MRRKKNVIENYQKCIFTFHCKGNVLVEANGIPEFNRTQFEYHLVG